MFAIVGNFFGGSGRYAKIEGREFTMTEGRIIRMVLRQAFADLTEAWSIVTSVNLEYLNSEINPSEIVVVTAFKIELEGGGDAIRGRGYRCCAAATAPREASRRSRSHNGFLGTSRRC